MDNRPIPIIADDRERQSPLLPLLHDDPRFALTVQRLELGDYLLDGRYLVERKRLPDLLASIKAGRLFSQCLRLVNRGDYRPLLLLEGTGREIADSRMSREAVQGAMVMIGVHLGLPLLRSRSAAESVKLLLFTARQGRSLARGTLPRPGRRPKGRRALQCHLLQGLPGIGPERAARLLDHFGSVGAVLCADADTLAQVAGVGRRTAGRIRWAVSETTAPYRIG